MAGRTTNKPSSFVIVTAQGYAPYRDFDAEAHAGYAPGTILEAVFHKPKSISLMRKFWMTARRVVDNSDRWGTSRDFANACLCELGFADSVALLGGGIHIFPRSIAEMDDNEFTTFFDKAMLLIREQVPGGIEILRDMEREFARGGGR